MSGDCGIRETETIPKASDAYVSDALRIQESRLTTPKDGTPDPEPR